MSDSSNNPENSGGTRFRVFAQSPFVEPYREPETIEVSSPAGSVGPGPADERMYVIDPIGKPMAYGLAEDQNGNPEYLLPPWPGQTYPPALPDENGHFDYLSIESPEFEAAHLFAIVRWTLDIWEKYLGHRIEWHFQKHFKQLELVLQRNLEENAFMGYGFLEVGFHRATDGEKEAFSLNFDVVAHEVGHCIIYAAVGVPDPGKKNAEYFGFHESAADITALIAALNFESVIDELLQETHGNLYTLNHANRIAELSNNEQIRIASNSMTMHDFTRGWSDEHDLAQPLTGAVFDIFVDIFHEELMSRDLISEKAEDLSDALEDDSDYHKVIQPIFDQAFVDAEVGFRNALIDARDTVGIYMAQTWRHLSPDHLGYDDIAETLLSVDQMINEGRYHTIISVNLQRRAIGLTKIGPRLDPPVPGGHLDLPRVFVPPERPKKWRGRMSYNERYNLNRG